MEKLLAQLGTITPPSGIPDVAGNPTNFVAGLIRGGIQLLLIVAMVVALIWTILAGFRFITSGGDPKNTGAAWQQIYFGLIGMLIVVGAFAIIKLIETFFNISIIGNFALPTR